MKIACYIRVSTEMQVSEGYSLDAQRDRLLNYCKSQDNWEIYDWYIDEGESAKDLKRKDMQRLLLDATKGLFDVVLVYKLDRLTRSVRDLHRLLDTFEKHSVKFRSATEVYDTTTAMGKLFITIVAALAEWERENLAERVRFGMEQLVSEGRWHGGPVPIGYDWDGSTMHVVDDEYTTLRELRRIYMSGDGFGSTSKKLNATGYTNRGSPWTAQSVWYVLDNPLYAGKIRYGSKKKNGKYATRKKEERVNVIWSETGFPTIFTWEEYEEHTLRMRRRQFYGHSKKREYWFSGVMKCARCGKTMVGRPYTNKRADGTVPEGIVNYICGGRMMRNGCNMPLLRQSVASSLIMEYIRRVAPISKGELLEAAKEEEQHARDHRSELDQLRKELKAVTERRKKWQYMFAEDLINESDFRYHKREEDEKERFILDRIEEVKAESIGVSAGFAQMMYDLPDVWDRLDDLDKKEFMQTIFKGIIVECDVENGKTISAKGKTLPFRIVDVNYN